jgi:hypothetical protein
LVHLGSLSNTGVGGVATVPLNLGPLLLSTQSERASRCCFRVRLSEYAGSGGRWLRGAVSAFIAWMAVRAASRGVGYAVVVKLEDVVGCCHQPPLRAGGGSSSSLEPVNPAVELDLAEHRLDRDLPLPVDLLAAVG